jgi:hypothetical protein
VKIIPSVWGSIVKHVNGLITELEAEFPQANIGFIDWEAHANIQEIPEQDLIGPTSLVLMEVSPQMYDVNFSIAVSTFGTDVNLFRHRSYISTIFESLRPSKQIPVYENGTNNELGYLIFQDGTGAMPMTRSLTRPFQYVQVNGLLEPAFGET